MTDIAPETVESPVVDENDLSQLAPDALGDDNGAQVEIYGEPQADDDSEEVEVAGAKYRIPKALKPELDKAADYTRKTMDLAEQRKAFDAERATYVGASTETVKALAKVENLNAQIAEYDKVDWNAVHVQDPDLATQHRFRLMDLQSQLNGAKGELQTREQTRQLEAQRETAKQLSQANEVLSRDIKGWGPELQAKLTTFATDRYGFKPEELGTITDPRWVKVMNDAQAGAQAQKTQAAQAVAQRTEAVKPTPKVGGGGTARVDPSKMSDAQFKAWANSKGGPLASRN